jgi:hypothetical protein
VKERKYAKNFITKDLMPPQPPEAIELMERQRREGEILDRTLLLGIHESILKGSFFAGCEWLWGLPGNKPVSIEMPHTHDSDEIIGFAGSNRNYPRDLCGKIEFWMEDEKYTVTKTCLIFIPRGVRHCPIVLNRIDTPYLYVRGGE